MLNHVLLRFECNHCNESQIKNFDKNIYTTWIPNDGFICGICYINNNNKDGYECVKLSKYFNLMNNRPYCDNCLKQITTSSWLFCEKCDYDFCNRCNLKNCLTCDNLLIKDKHNFSD